MKTNKRVALAIGLSILVVLSIAIPLYFVFKDKDRRIDHEPIIIWKDADFERFAFAGSGTVEDPYRIENLKIVTDYRYSIYISDTTKHFTIDNCYLDASETGIYISDIALGTADVTDNICENNIIGIRVKDSDRVLIDNNHCINNKNLTGGGIFVEKSSYSNITNNQCNSNEIYGIKLENTENCNVINNTCNSNFGTFQGSAGIYVYTSVGTTIAGNTCNNNRKYGVFISVSEQTLLIYNLIEESHNAAVHIQSSTQIEIINNTISNNINQLGMASNALEVIYSDDCNIFGNIFDSNLGNGIYLDTVDNCMISNNILSNHIEYLDSNLYGYYVFLGYGVLSYSSNDLSIISNTMENNYGGCWIAESNNTAVAFNTITNNREYSLNVFDSENGSLFNNTISSNSYGVFLDNSILTEIAFNRIQQNEYYGLTFNRSSNSNVAHHNSFIDNNLAGISQGYDEGLDNFWFDNDTLSGNFWSNRIGSNYTIDGPSNSVDLYPLDEDPLITILNAESIDLIEKFLSKFITQDCLTVSWSKFHILYYSFFQKLKLDPLEHQSTNVEK